jgi:pSer/pThr/pTyr-binding forkhead associated (FHA) protein/outer membrane protein assembly factor BamB
MVSEKRLTFGRDKSNGVVLDDSGISGFHAELHYEDGKMTLIDIGSVNGSYINDEKVHGRREAKLWDCIRLDSIEFEIVDSEKRRPTEVHVAISESDIQAAKVSRASTSAGTATKTTVMPAIRPKLVGESGLFSGRIFDLKLPATIGRGAQNTVLIDDDTASTQHARISDDGNGWRIDDLGSTNGTFVNNAKISSSALSNGDKVRFGKVDMRFDTGAPMPSRTTVMPTVSIETRTAVQSVVEPRGIPAWVYGLGSFLVVGAAAFVLLYGEKINFKNLGAAEQIQAPLQAGQTWMQQLPNGRNSPSTPVVADINGDKVLDLIVGDAHGFLTAIDGGTGKQIFELDIGDRILASLVSADLTGQGLADIVVSTNTGNVAAVNGKGQVLWKTGAGLDLGQIVNRPVLHDINGDKIPDVIVPTMGKGLVALDGSRGWKIWDTSGMTKGNVITSPLAVDLNGDGVMDFAVVTDAGEVLAVSTQGKTVLQLWKADIPKVIYASPTYAKLGKSGMVMVATEAGIVALAAESGRQIWQTKRPANFFSSPVSASLNGDEVGDVVAVTTDGNVFAYDGKTGDEIWTLALGVGVGVKASPALYDFNGDKTLDIVLLDETGTLHIIDGNRGRSLLKTQIAGADSFVASPILADINSDGMLEVITASGNGQIAVYSLNRMIGKGIAPWPMFLGNDRHAAQ